MAEDKSVPQGANKYSVYAQRDVDSTQFNWANAASDITKSFTDVRDDRKKRKEDLENSFDESMSVLEQVESMQTKSAGEKITEASQSSVDALVKQNELMLSGKISVRDYQRFESRLKSGYANVNKVVKEFDTWQAETNQRMTEGLSGYLEIGNAQDVQPLGEFSAYELVTNPFTGNLSYAKLVKNESTGKMELPKTSSEFIPPSKVFASMGYRQNKYDVRKAVTGITDNVATVITAFKESYAEDGSGGSVKSIEDFRQIGEVGTTGLGYNKWLDTSVDSVVNNTTAGQILYDNGYGAAKDIATFNKRFPGLDESKWIEYKNENGVLVPNYTPAQMAKAKEIVRDMIESQIDSKFTQTPGTGPQSESAAQLALRLKNESVKIDLDIANDIATGNLGDFLSSGSQGIISVNKRLSEAGVTSKDAFIDSIKRQGDEIIIEYQSERKATPIQRKNTNGTFRTTEEISKEIYQLISPFGKSFVNDLATAKKGGFAFDLNVRDKTKAEVESMLEINKAKEYLITNGVSNPTPAQIKQVIEDEEIEQITQEELNEVMESGKIPQIYTGEDAVQYASREALQTKNVGDNIAKSVGAKLNDTTGADYIKQKYNTSTGQDEDNLKTLTTYNRFKDGRQVRAEALQGPMQATLSGYLPKKLRGKVGMTLKDDGTIEVKYDKETLDITGVTDITLGQNETFEMLDALTNQIAQNVTERYNIALQNRKGGSPTAAQVADAPAPDSTINPGDALYNEATTKETVVLENERQDVTSDSIINVANSVRPTGPSQQSAPDNTGMSVNNPNPLSQEEFNKIEIGVQNRLSKIDAEKNDIAKRAEIDTLAQSLSKSDNPDILLKAIIKYDTSLTNNPLVFAEKYLGVSENNPEEQATVQGFLNDAVPGYAQNPEDVTKDEMAWCAAFMNNILNEGNLDTLDYGKDKYNLIRAKQYSKIGEPVDSIDSATPGDIIVTQKDGQFHVGLYAGKKGGKNLLLGGNQKNRVSVKEINNDSVYSVRRINTIGKVEEKDLQRIINTQYYDQLTSTDNTTR